MAPGLTAGMAAGLIFFTPVWNVIQRPLCSTVIRGIDTAVRTGA
jgi:hypothetical protein